MTSKRAKLIADLFGDSKGFLPQAKIIKFDRKLHFIPDDELINFAIFTDNFRANFVSTELAVHKASIAWQRMTFERVKYVGGSFFRGLEEMISFCREAYRGEALCSCEDGSGYLPYVVITVDDEGNLRNSASINENGVFKRLDSSETSQIYSWLFANQHKIGDVKRISREDYERSIAKERMSALSAPKQQEITISDKSLKLIEKTIKRIGK
ncbi:hypothetical protein [Campylobacter sp. 7477a]|uniref:hypothetical protein n=1 Tax=Campylobacter sp. 7477a TaxID=2735741 RepID=UPI0030145B09|nr:hypothetical protein [Campylobacter sp. 7477a]